MVRAIDEFLQKLSTNVALFNGLDVPRLERLVTGAERVNVTKDKLFFNEGDIGYNFSFCSRGRPSLKRGMDTIGPNWLNSAQAKPSARWR